jgi:hypothetical protein
MSEERRFGKPTNEIGVRNKYYGNQKIKSLLELKEEDRGRPYLETHDEKERNYLRYYPLARKAAMLKFSINNNELDIIIAIHDFIYVNAKYTSDLVGLSETTVFNIFSDLCKKGYLSKLTKKGFREAKKYGMDVFKFGVTTKGKGIARYVYNFCERYEVKQ